MTDILPTGMAARRKTALAARVQLEALAAGKRFRDIARPVLLELGRDRPTECAAQAAKPEKARPPVAAPDYPMVNQPTIGQLIAASIRTQAQLKRDWVAALTRELEERRLVAGELIIDALSMIAPDERREFVDAALKRVEELERRSTGPAV